MKKKTRRSVIWRSIELCSWRQINATRREERYQKNFSSVHINGLKYFREAKDARRRALYTWVSYNGSMLGPFPKSYISSTLFVSNLPYTATSVDLQTLFSDIAPVRSAFVVSEQGTGVSKGVGYVSFAIKEDAEAAYENLSTDGISLVGRKLRIQWADQKVF